MKKIMVGIFALVLCLSSFKGMAQTSYTPEQMLQHVKESMASFTSNVSFVYRDGMSVEEFKNILCNGQPVATREGDDILNKSFDYLSRRLSFEEIVKSDDGLVFTKGLKYLYENRSSEDIGENDAKKLFGENLLENPPSSAVGAKPCRWYDIFCHLGNFFDWLFAHWKDIFNIWKDICSLIHC